MAKIPVVDFSKDDCLKPGTSLCSRHAETSAVHSKISAVSRQFFPTKFQRNLPTPSCLHLTTCLIFQPVLLKSLSSMQLLILGNEPTGSSTAQTLTMFNNSHISFGPMETINFGMIAITSAFLRSQYRYLLY